MTDGEEQEFGNNPSEPSIYFHHSDECGPVVYLLGLIALDWNYCEHLFSTLIWHYVGGHETGLSITPKMGNQTRADVLLDLARKFEPDSGVLDRIQFARKALNQLREVRNVLMHTHSIIPHESGSYEWRRASTKAPTGHGASLANLDELTQTINAIGTLAMFILQIVLLHMAREKGDELPELPEKFEMPKKLTQLPFEELPED